MKMTENDNENRLINRKMAVRIVRAEKQKQRMAKIVSAKYEEIIDKAWPSVFSVINLREENEISAISHGGGGVA